MNKGLEVIEAKWLFDLKVDQIEVVIHPESIIHSMVQYQDRSVIAQLGLPDMKLPILYALNYPTRVKTEYESLDLTKIGQLNFLKPDLEKFKALSLAYKSIEIGHTMPVVLNTANEIYVQKFLENKIGFLEISESVEREMKNHDIIKNPTIEDIIKIENEMKERLI
jgi:1-deoxy-D-xylulose-5-phosphate reductoisomerase